MVAAALLIGAARRLVEHIEGVAAETALRAALGCSTGARRRFNSCNRPQVSSLICVKRGRGSETKLASNRSLNTEIVPENRHSEFSALLQAQRELLLAEVRTRIAASGDGLGLANQSKITDDDGLADAAAEMDVAMLIRESQELQEIEAALARIADGSYGTCYDCGAEIGTARLKANPAARRCLPCQEKYEHAQDRSH